MAAPAPTPTPSPDRRPYHQFPGHRFHQPVYHIRFRNWWIIPLAIMVAIFVTIAVVRYFVKRGSPPPEAPPAPAVELNPPPGHSHPRRFNKISSVSNSPWYTNSQGSMSKTEREMWTPEMDDALVDAFLHQQTTGNKVGGAFTSKAYDSIIKELQEKIERPFDKS